MLPSATRKRASLLPSPYLPHSCAVLILVINTVYVSDGWIAAHYRRYAGQVLINPSVLLTNFRCNLTNTLFVSNT